MHRSRPEANPERTLPPKGGLPRLRRAGYTLVELLVVTAILGILVSYLFGTVTTQQQTYVVIDQVTEAQQNLRLVADLIEREVRVAGYLVPPAAGACAADFTDQPDRLYVSAADRVQPVNQLWASGETDAVKNSLYAGVDEGDLGLGPLGANETFDLDKLWLDVAADGKDFFEGEGLILVDLEDDERVVACGRITRLLPGEPLDGPATVTVAFENNRLVVNTNSEIVAVPAHVYRVEPQGAGANPALSQLFRDGDLLANDVEDLQVVFYFDDDDDRVIDAGELFGDVAVPLYPPPATTNYGRLVEIQVNLVTVTRDDDPNQRFTRMRGQPTANRAANTVPGANPAPGDPVDRRRRRVHRSAVRLRNLG